MTGEIEEPFSLDFQVDSFRCGSISFGRYESEALCWQRWSSFSHNSYLEDVQKCSKPGLVTEKKAYFEAHFRKKGFPGQTSSECQDQISENDISEKMDYDGETDSRTIFDESPVGSVNGSETLVSETSFSMPQVELVSENTNPPEKVEEADSVSGIEMKERIDDETVIVPIDVNKNNTNASKKDNHVSLPEEKISSEDKRRNLKPRGGVGQSRRYTSRNASKPSDNKTTKTVPLRSKPEKKAPEASSKSSMQKAPKYEAGSKTKGVHEVNSAEKESRRRIIMEASKKVPNRVHQSSDRVKPAVSKTETHMQRNISTCSVKSDGRGERRKEFDKKLEGKVQAKEASNNMKPQILSTSKPSYPGNRMSKSSQSPLCSKTKTGIKKVSIKTAEPLQASGTTSCHSTVTSDSSTPSLAGTNNSHPKKAGTRNPVVQKKDQEKEKLTSLRRLNTQESRHKQKTRAGRSSYALYNGSSRTGSMTVGVAS